MKTRIFVAFLLSAASLTASAQRYAGTTLEDRIGHGQDSIHVLSNISLYREAFKAKNWEEALESWKFVFEKAPLSQVRLYQDGAWMLSQLTQSATEPAKKQEYFDLLMKVYDQRAANLEDLNSIATPKTVSTLGNVLCRKAYDYYYYSPKMDNNTAYKMFRDGIEDMGPNTEAFVLFGFIECSYNRFMMNKDNASVREDFIRDYMETNDICDRLLEQAKEYPAEVIPADPESADSTRWVEQVVLAPEAQKIVDNYQPTQDRCNDLFVKSGAADCDALEKIYSEKVEANKTDLAYLNGVLGVLTNFHCDKSNIYYVASDYAYQLNKTPNAAIGKAQKLLKEGNSTDAMRYLNEAIELETDNVKRSKIAFTIAQILYSKGNIGGCRQYCNKSLQYVPSNGKAYLLIANCIVRSASGDHLQKSYYYCLATDKCLKAKSVDPACAAQANRQIASYTAGYYPKSEAFFAGLKAGQSVSVMGETTTLRLR